MRRILWVGAVLAALLGCAGSAQASIEIELTITYTGDDVVSAFYKDGAAPERVDITGNPNNGNWRSADTVTVSGLKPGTEYQFFFQVHNEGPAACWNHAAFLAEISGHAVGNPSALATSNSWDYLVDPYKGVQDEDGNPPPVDESLWARATEWPHYGKYIQINGAPIKEASTGGNNTVGSFAGQIEDISSEARWIWGPHNGEQLKDFPEEKYLWLRATITTGLPEPSTLIIWSLLGASGAGLSVWRRRRGGRFMGGAVPRAAWSEENRQAIRQIIARGGSR
ncbi:MAG: hypothetical protein NTW96_01515 [Planctomycetia bacterium]|nr:hypothetical protein [Planctomycetia bacterium]